MCLYPKLITNPKYKPNGKNKGVIPPCSDERVMKVPIKCGKCMECRKAIKREWQVRLHEEIKTDKRGQFVTLSFSNEALAELEEKAKAEDPELEGYELENAAAIIAIRTFTENWRSEKGKQPRRWLITELGQTRTERIHIHGIIWTLDKQAIREIWKYGNVYIGTYVNGQTVNYIVKYVHKQDFIHPNYKPRILCSKGIGAGYTASAWKERNKFKGADTREYYETAQGYKINLPVYYRNKIYTEEQREKLWLAKLDKQERWVDGIKTDISKSEKEYYALLAQARERSRRLGYGNGEKNWSKIRYEQERRILMKKRRDEQMVKRNTRLLDQDKSDSNMGNNNNSDISTMQMQSLGKKFDNYKESRIQPYSEETISNFMRQTEIQKKFIWGNHKDEE
ncbi:MAG: replication initiator protein [Microviridae sp.]|nr:MAG: replication initiator protein [Microviridae sp.]